MKNKVIFLIILSLCLPCFTFAENKEAYIRRAMMDITLDRLERQQRSSHRLVKNLPDEYKKIVEDNEEKPDVLPQAALLSKKEPFVNKGWEFGTEISHITYKEPDVMREKGVMLGTTGAYTYYGLLPSSYMSDDKCIMLRGEARYSGGLVDYKNSGTINDIRDYMVEARGLAGYVFGSLTDFSVTPYLGFGYRYLNDDTSGKVSSTGALGYERESNYYYSPIGAEMLWDINNSWLIGTTLEYDYFWGGKQISHLSDVNRGFSDLKNDQHSGHGLRGSLKVLKKLDYLDLFFEPFIRYWRVAQSKNTDVTYRGVIVGYGYEPKNNSTEIGMKLGARF